MTEKWHWYPNLSDLVAGENAKLKTALEAIRTEADGVLQFVSKRPTHVGFEDLLVSLEEILKIAEAELGG